MRNLTVTGGAVAATALLVVLAGCGSSPAGKSAACFKGRYQLTAQTPSARPGALVTLAANGPTAPDQATIESWGVFETAAGDPLWNVEALTQGESAAGADVHARSNVTLGATGLRNIPFRVRVPTVGAGKYLIQFTYTFGQPRHRGKNYQLCASIHVS